MRLAPGRLFAFTGGMTAAVLALVWTVVAASGAWAAEFYVCGHGWHTGIVVPRAAAATSGAWPAGVAEQDFAACGWLELGWGDRKFYMAKHPGVALAVGAALVPGQSVLHVVGLRGSPARAYRQGALVRVPCTDAELGALNRTLGATFARDAAGQAPSLGPGLYGFKSGFYAARGRYWIGNTCNSWTLRMVRAGGLPTRVGPRGTLQAGAVLAQTRRLLSNR